LDLIFIIHETFSQIINADRLILTIVIIKKKVCTSTGHVFLKSQGFENNITLFKYII